LASISPPLYGGVGGTRALAHSIDKLQIKAIKEISMRIGKLEKEKQTKLFYAMPKVDLCNISLF
jgi:hypothetical protein